MSLPGSNSTGAGRGDEDTTLVTAMIVVATVFLAACTILLSVWLHSSYGKFFWEIGG